jgi:hypothetical protein
MRPHHIPFYLSINQRTSETPAESHPDEQTVEGRAMSEISTGPHHNPGRYEIRLKGHLDSRWAAWFDGLSLTNQSDGTTIIRGPVADQAALHGLLQKVRDIGLPLVSVTQVQPDQPERLPSRPGNSSIQPRRPT